MLFRSKEIRCVDLIGKRWMCNQEVAGLFGNEFSEFCKAVVEKGECEFYNLVREKKGLTVEARKVALQKLLPMQRGDFRGIFLALEGMPVRTPSEAPPRSFAEQMSFDQVQAAQKGDKASGRDRKSVV